MGSPSTLVVILSSIFAFILLVFSGMLLCFTWRTRKGRRGVVAGHSANNNVNSNSRNMIPREERWSQRGRNAANLSKSEDAMFEVNNNNNNASEWGATVHDDGTRSYLRGWFGLDRPSPVNSLTSASSRGQHYRLEQGIEMDREDEWEAKSIVSSGESDGATLHNQPTGAMHIDAEKEEQKESTQ